MSDRPSCYPEPSRDASASVRTERMPLLDVLTSPVPSGVFDSPVDGRHVLCLHVGEPVPVSYRMGSRERAGRRIHGQFCVVPAGTSTRWIVSAPARSLLLRLAPSLLPETADFMGVDARCATLTSSIHIRDAQVERIGWMMQAEEQAAYPSGRLFADSLASALAARLLTLQSRRSTTETSAGTLPAWRLRNVIDYIEAHLDQPLSLAELAAVAGFSVSHFKPLFARSVGMPVHRFVIERRVERARMRLVEGGRSFTEIAMEAGFAHPSHMALWMRRMLGRTPSEIARDSVQH